MEIGSYRILVATAKSIGDRETQEACQSILEEEIVDGEVVGRAFFDVYRKFSAARGKCCFAAVGETSVGEYMARLGRFYRRSV